MSKTAIRSERAALLILSRIADAHGLKVEQVRGKSPSRDLMAVRDEAIFALRSELRLSIRETATRMQVGKTTIERGYRRHTDKLSRAGGQKSKAPAIVAAAHTMRALDNARPSDALKEEIAELQAELARLSGADLAVMLVGRIEGMNVSEALVLATLGEAYPRPVNTSVMCELYEAGKGRLGLDAKPISESMINVTVMELRRLFEKRGWPDPVEVLQGVKARKLSNAAACFLSAKFGVPKASALPDQHWRDMRAFITDLPIPLHRSAKERSAVRSAAALCSGVAGKAVRRASSPATPRRSQN